MQVVDMPVVSSCGVERHGPGGAGPVHVHTEGDSRRGSRWGQWTWPCRTPGRRGLAAGTILVASSSWCMASRHGERVVNVNLMREKGRAGKERRARGRAPDCRNECLIDRGASGVGRRGAECRWSRRGKSCGVVKVLGVWKVGINGDPGRERLRVPRSSCRGRRVQS